MHEKTERTRMKDIERKGHSAQRNQNTENAGIENTTG